MRLSRAVAVGVVLLALVGVFLGASCAGPQGERGPQGEAGAMGPAGPAGSAGPEGPQGLQGLQGPQGAQGPQGLPGVGIVWQGEWSRSTVYRKDEAVGFQGYSYISKQDSNGDHEPTDGDWWYSWGAVGPQGPRGETGPAGAAGVQGPQGIQGEPGPNMIVAMGNVLANGSVSCGYNVGSVSWDAANSRYQITLTGVNYVPTDYVTVVTPGGEFLGRYDGLSGRLLVYLYDLSGQAQGPFSFIVLKTP